ncbi:hypothetical protein HXV90_03100 [Lysinibacillus sp. JK80]|uniref:hypothetical protein n=1 Tax=Lysinibacillus sp. JK80 TaxID=2749809 RepID=UPI0022B954CC|nr:hypothetical protein [Lysinibacillus sp. JK80]WBF54912.1 hypothetical protein HXV90_03100 [Lysinibacillus sp. JK80]
MPFRKPVPTLGGLSFWKNVKQDTYFIMQKHKTGVWPYKYRILLRENTKEIANAKDLETINFDWEYLQNHAVPRLNEKGFLDIEDLLKDLLKVVPSIILKK